ncbi:hypothetical protein K461DRAFT_292513 [Myriangium duriaei CBS 260.36]|uniref:Uncharacterized protein n=1 Tax=Myriangium duriaei CBS 260.36 TaxID=1168546 RepID=A0A9P4J1K9_9PEZI|nr:hypothetical protein K461DRAFT_292513 [Myriangium duriaei CBS 260.36]
MAVGSLYQLPTVEIVEQQLRDVLSFALDQVGGATSSEPLSSKTLDQSITQLKEALHNATQESQIASVLETAARRIFYHNLKSTTVVQPESHRIWTFLDVLLLLSETRQTGRSIIWYLIEELVESQTADSCRIVFDYLDSRRERLTEREFQVTHLIILRTCNELLRRLSRAEDATFCGRVFFFLFQIFPLGEQSSVNLRGEFHTDNVTIFDESATSTPTATQVTSPAAHDENDESKKQISDPEKVKQPGSKSGDNDLAKFYSIFWRLQQDFSMPTRLIESDEHFTSFKTGLERTIEVFSKTPVVKTKSVADDSRGVKRKRGTQDDTAYQGDYNPKYLTSRELFELELSDLSFQRHILVQALILVDFLLSLSEQAQKKLDSSGIPRLNSSVNYSHTLSEEKKEWAQSIRSKITSYLQQGPDGSFYYRMVNTVLARDKNWIWWKIQRCPPIVAEAVKADEYLSAREGAIRATATRRMRAKPMGAMDLTFLSEAGSARGLQSLKDPARFQTPSIDQLIEQVSREELDLDFADGEEKEAIQSKIDSLSWRAIRAGSRTCLAKLDKLEPGKRLQEVLAQEKPAQEVEGSGAVEGKTPEVQVA